MAKPAPRPRALGLGRVNRLMRGSAFIDLRNVRRSHDAAAAGLDHFGIGIGIRVNADLKEAAE